MGSDTDDVDPKFMGELLYLARNSGGRPDDAEVIEWLRSREFVKPQVGALGGYVVTQEGHAWLLSTKYTKYLGSKHVNK